MLRRGPRPLLLHLMLAAMNSSGCAGGSPGWSSVWQSWNAAPGGAAGAASGPEGAAQQALAAALRAAMAGDRALVAGIAAYRRHPAQRCMVEPPVIWSRGEARLSDYAPGAPGRPVVFVPSLINRGYILDLAPGASLLRYLAAEGLRPLLLDWGWPGEAARRETLTDVIAGVLEAALLAVGGPMTLVGYCMGGLLAVAVAQRRPDLVRAIGVLATPWDFRAGDAAQAERVAQVLPMIQPVLDAGGALPVDMLQALFVMLDPQAVARKYRRFGTLDQDSEVARRFVAIEDWANDGVPLAAPVARECFADWYGKNTPSRGAWRVAGEPVSPAALRIPAFAAIPGQDRIVPPASAWPLAQALAGAKVIEPRSGHIGMIAGSGAEMQLWRPLRDWLCCDALAGG
jgi:polyhydroxyalkanoate synthase